LSLFHYLCHGKIPIIIYLLLISLEIVTDLSLKVTKSKCIKCKISIEEANFLLTLSCIYCTKKQKEIFFFPANCLENQTHKVLLIQFYFRNGCLSFKIHSSHSISKRSPSDETIYVFPSMQMEKFATEDPVPGKLWAIYIHKCLQWDERHDKRPLRK